MFRQLERQVLLNTGLAKRCSSLASELTVLTGIAEAVLRNRDIDAALDEAIASCFDAGGVSFGALYLVSGAARTTRSAMRTLGADVPTRQPVATFFGREAMLRNVIRSGQPLYIPSPDVGESAALLADAGARAILIVPLSNPAGPLGALLMVSRDRDLDETDWRAFAQGVSMQISQVLTLARAYADLEAAERKAEAHAAVLGAVFENAPDLVVQLDRTGVIRFVNRVEPPIKTSDVLGTNCFDRIAPDQRKQAHEAFESVITSGAPAGRSQLHVLRADQSAGFFQCRIGAIKQDHTVTGCVIVARDVTDKKQTEMQLMLADRMASVGTLAAGVAHEINNPLAAVIANLDMAEHDIRELGNTTKLPPDLVDEVHDARMSADRVREIVRDLKVFSRAQEIGAARSTSRRCSSRRCAWRGTRSATARRSSRRMARCRASTRTRVVSARCS